MNLTTMDPSLITVIIIQVATLLTTIVTVISTYAKSRDDRKAASDTLIEQNKLAADNIDRQNKHDEFRAERDHRWAAEASVLLASSVAAESEAARAKLADQVAVVAAKVDVAITKLAP